MEENKFLHFFKQYWSKILLGVLALACIGAWGERFFKSNRSQNRNDFLVANKIFEKLQKGERLPIESVELVEKILKKHPELHAKFDPLLAATFFSQHNVAKGLLYAHSILEKVGNYLSSYYQAFANTSLCILEGHLATAFEEASLLSRQLENRPEYETLYAMNLLRLIFLADKLSFSDTKQEAWEKLKNLPFHANLEPLFQEGSLSLEEYVRAH